MASDREIMVHLAGYATLSGVLATADWASLIAPVLALPLIAGAIYVGGRMFVERLVGRARAGLEERQAVATDGGRRTTTLDRELEEGEP